MPSSPRSRPLAITPARFCKVCGGQLEGRRDKKYCNQECKNIYHKNLRLAHRKELEIDMKILFRNRTILMELLDQEGTLKRKISLDILVFMGFQMDYYTGGYTNSRDKEYKYVFDYAWMRFSDREVLILKKEDALKSSAS